MNPLQQHALLQTRRHFFSRTATGIGTAALASLVNPNLFAAEAGNTPKIVSSKDQGVLGKPHFAPKAKRIIYLFAAGAPAQQDMYGSFGKKCPTC
jgi:hypothetical protein